MKRSFFQAAVVSILLYGCTTWTLTKRLKKKKLDGNYTRMFRRYPWCNGYRRRKWTRRHKFKSWTRLIAFHIALIPLGKVWIQLFSCQLWVNSRTDCVLPPWWGKLWIQTCYTPLKNWPCVISCPSGGVGKYDYTRMLRAILNKSWQQHPTRHQLYDHLPPITKTIQVRRTRHAGHCWRSKDELISDVLLWNPAYGQAKAGRPVRTYIQQLCEDTGCSPEDLPEAMNDKEKWRERVRDIRASGMTWWWW